MESISWQIYFMLASCFNLIIVFYMLLRLYATRSNKSYIQFSGYVLFNFLMYCGMFYVINSMENTPSLSEGYVSLIFSSWSLISFVLMNAGIYRLYKAFTFEAQMTTYLAIAFVVIFSLISLMFSPRIYASIFIFFDIVALVLSMLLVRRFVEQKVKFTFSLIGIWSLTILFSLDTLFQIDQIITTSIYGLTFIGYSIFFIIIFERSIELMQLVYHSSITDGLTGLYNRKYFYNFLEREIKINSNVGAIFTDIDNFKKLNDTQGHQKGDEALRHVAKIAKEVADGIGIAGRYGGEEIVLIILGGNIKELAELLRARIEKEAGVTVSVGYHTYVAGTSPGDFLKQSDIAMYHSKQNGKNRVTGYKELSPEQLALMAK